MTIPKGNTFHTDINKVTDMLLLSKEEFLNSYSYLSEDDYNMTIESILFNLFSYEQRKSYKEYLVKEGLEEFANEIIV